jgi:hypothetical protein
MDEIRCPMCGKLNTKGLDICQFCGARLTPMVASKPIDTKPIKAGEHPSKQEDADIEDGNQVAGERVQAGEAPTKKNMAELEPTLPSWLRSLRESQESSEGETEAEISAEQELPFRSREGGFGRGRRNP